MSRHSSASDGSNVEVGGGDSVTTEDSYVRVQIPDRDSSVISPDDDSYVYVDSIGRDISGLSVGLRFMALDDDEGKISNVTKGKASSSNRDTEVMAVRTKDETNLEGAADVGFMDSADDEERKTGAPPIHLLFEGTLEQAITIANVQNRLVLVSLERYDMQNGFVPMKENRHIFRLHQFQFLVSERYILLQFSILSKRGAEYARHYQVERFPHIGILHPFHRTMVWGVDGYNDENPLEPAVVMEQLVHWGFANFTCDHFERVKAEQRIRGKKSMYDKPSLRASKKITTTKHIIASSRKNKPSKTVSRVSRTSRFSPDRRTSPPGVSETTNEKQDSKV